MAKVNYMNAILSGRLDGQVYAHNQYGAYVRKYKPPTNPNSGAQVLSRSLFNQAMTSWAALGNIARLQWEEWGAVHGVAGVNVYCGQYVAWYKSDSLKRVSQIVFGSTESVIDGDQTSDIHIPEGKITNVLYMGGFQPTGIIIEDGEIKVDDGKINLECRLTNPGTNVQIRDLESGLHRAFYVKGSRPSQTKTGYFNPYQSKILGRTKFYNNFTSYTSSDILHVNFPNADLDLLKYKSWYGHKDWVLVELWMIDRAGQTIKASEAVLQVT